MSTAAQNQSAQASGACKPTYTPAAFKAELQLLSGKACLDALTEHSACNVTGCTAPPIGVGTLPDDNDYSAVTLCVEHACGVEAGLITNIPVFDAEDGRAYIKHAYLNQLRALVASGEFPFFARTPAALSGELDSNEGMLVLEIDGVPGVIPFAMPYELGDPFFFRNAEIRMMANLLLNDKSLTVMGPSRGHRLGVMEVTKADFIPFPKVAA